MINFGEILKQKRKESGASLAEMGKEIGVSNSILSLVEKGTAKISWSLFTRISDYFNLTVSERKEFYIFSCVTRGKIILDDGMIDKNEFVSLCYSVADALWD